MTLARRLPSTPPVLPGFSHLHVLGSGGFADVFLYEQNLPRRQVAVKVMLHELMDEQARQMFQAETNLMAPLSAHPSILTIYDAGVAADGRPYLVMELCSTELARRYREEPLPVAEVLEIAIRIGGAIETAHRAGVLHRDIKPSNILLTAYDHPVLADFGIASTIAASAEEESIGLSIPWSAPEVLLDETSGSRASEVWSFAATVYSLLAGRSPFEIPGGDNSSAELVNRITRQRPRPIGRPDVPPELEQLLRSALLRDPARRPASVLELVRGLQSVEAALGLPTTPVEIARDDWALGSGHDPDDRTRLRAVPGPAERPRRGRPGTASQPTPERRVPLRPARSSSRVLLPALLAVSALAIAAIVVAVVAIVSPVSGDRVGIPVVRDIVAADVGGGIEFSWDDPGVAVGDKYQLRTRDGAESIQDGTRYVIDAEAGETVCITVRVNRQGSTGPPSVESCAEVPGG